jgi:hypothetical protein
MAETEKDDGDDQLREEEKERYGCGVQNPFVTGKIEVSEEQL